jgi:hypothetical protein
MSPDPRPTERVDTPKIQSTGAAEAAGKLSWIKTLIATFVLFERPAVSCSSGKQKAASFETAFPLSATKGLIPQSPTAPPAGVALIRFAVSGMEQ